jgi:undecaprenyl-diphosphatase
VEILLLIKAALMGVVEGLTEFLPISSTGHLVIAESALGVSKDDFGLRFDAAIHLGTLAAVLVYFRLTLLNLVFAWLDSLRRRSWRATPQSRLAWLLLLGTVPGGLVGLALESTAEDAFRDPALVAVMLILFCAPMLAAEGVGRRARGIETAGLADAVFVGVAQAVALIPGVSRSGITIAAGMLRDLRREDAAEFAFLLSAPIIAAAGGKQLFDALSGGNGGAGRDPAVYAVGLISAAVVGYVAIAFLMRYLQVNSLNVFVVYRVAAGIGVLAFAAAGLL